MTHHAEIECPQRLPNYDCLYVQNSLVICLQGLKPYHSWNCSCINSTSCRKTCLSYGISPAHDTNTVVCLGDPIAVSMHADLFIWDLDPSSYHADSGLGFLLDRFQCLECGCSVVCLGGPFSICNATQEVWNCLYFYRHGQAWCLAIADEDVMQDDMAIKI